MGAVAVVSGGRGAIGTAIAEALHGDGYSVACWDVTTVDGQSSSCLQLQCDLTRPAEVTSAVETTRRQLGPISILVNAVGVAQPHALFVDMTAAEWDDVIHVNLVAPVNCMRAVTDDMRGQKSGVIVNICSIWSTHAAARYRSAYIASKWALLGATQAIATELAVDGIRVCAVSPGPVDTPMTAEMASSETRRQWMTAADVAAAVRYAVSSGASGLVGGELQLFGRARPDPEL